jgi:hypothetical protein
MLEMGTSGSMSGEGKPPAASRSRSSALPRLYSRKVHARQKWRVFLQPPSVRPAKWGIFNRR